MKQAIVLFLSLMTGIAVAQTLQFNVPRPAYPYEVLDSVPEGLVSEADRLRVDDFLSNKKDARTGFIIDTKGLCPLFLNGDLTIREVAVDLDKEVDLMNAAIATAYDRMMASLSADAVAAVQEEVQRSDTKTSADTRLVALQAIAPGAVERMFRHICESE